MSDRAALAYISGWVLACLIALIVLWRDRHACLLFTRAHARYLFRPWKVVSFLVAATFMVLAAPYTGDPTWDHVDGGFMSILTYLTAPWAVGTLARYRHGLASGRQAYVAACAWLFSASWSYDIYLYFRDGHYNAIWWANLWASSMLYLCAGLMWNLCYSPKLGQHFGFSDQAWPEVDADAGFRRVAPVAATFMILVGGMMLPFVWPHIQRWMATGIR